MPILMNDAETWIWTKADINTLTEAEMRLKSIVRKARREGIKKLKRKKII